MRKLCDLRLSSPGVGAAGVSGGTSKKESKGIMTNGRNCELSRFALKAVPLPPARLAGGSVWVSAAAELASNPAPTCDGRPEPGGRA